MPPLHIALVFCCAIVTYVHVGIVAHYIERIEAVIEKTYRSVNLLMKKLFHTRAKGGEKPSKGPPVAKKPIRTAGNVETKKVGGTGYETKKSKESAEFVPIPRPKNSLRGYNRKCPSSEEQLKEIGPPIPLSRVKEYHSLPCLVKFCQGYTSLCESHSFGTDQFFVVLEQKRITAAVMRDCDQEFVIPISTNSFRVVPSLSDFPERNFNARELLEYPSLPPVVQVTKEFRTASSNIGTILAGARLFSLDYLYNLGRNEEPVKVLDRLAGEMEDGTRVEILADCAGEFSVNKHDIQLELATAIRHIRVPFSCKLIPLDDDIYNISVSVERVENMDALCGVMTIDENINLEDEVYSFQRRSEVPTSVDVMVVAMAPIKPKAIESVYATALSFYELVPWSSVREEMSGESKSFLSDAVYANVSSASTLPLSVSITKSPVYGYSSANVDGSKRPPTRSFSYSSNLPHNHCDSSSDGSKRPPVRFYSHSSNSPYNRRDLSADESKRPPTRSYSHSSNSPYNSRNSSSDERKHPQTQSYSHLSNSPHNRRNSASDERKHPQTQSYSHLSISPHNRRDSSSDESKQSPSQSFNLSSSLPYNYGDSNLDESKPSPTRSYSISSYPAYENHDPPWNGSSRASFQGSRLSSTGPSSHVYGNFDLRNEGTQEVQQSDVSNSPMNEFYDTFPDSSRQQSPPLDVSISLCPVYSQNNPYLDVGTYPAESSVEDSEDRAVYEYVSLKPRYSLGDSKPMRERSSLSTSPQKGTYSNFARTSQAEIQKKNSPPENPNNVDPQSNIEYLHTLSTSDVSKLLDSMNLSQYRDIFQREHINGVLMSELDMDMLVEMGIQNKLHRLRLIRISTGRDSVQSLLEKHCSHY